MLYLLHQLTSRAIDNLVNKNLKAYGTVYKEFMDIFKTEEILLGKTDILYINILQQGQKTRSFWYFYALDCPKGLYSLFIQHIQPRFADLDNNNMAEFERTMTPYQATNTSKLITIKIKDKEVYASQL